MERRRTNDRLSIPAVVRIKQDNGKIRVFRRRELIGLISIPSKMSGKLKALEDMPGIMGYWEYYAAIYDARLHALQGAYEKLEAKTKRVIERMILTGEGMKGENWGSEFITPHNINGIFYEQGDVLEAREKLYKARRKAAIIGVIASVLRRKNYNLNTLVAKKNFNN